MCYFGNKCSRYNQHENLSSQVWRVDGKAETHEHLEQLEQVEARTLKWKYESRSGVRASNIGTHV